MIDISSEQMLTLTQAAKLLPGRPSVVTLWRWRSKGVKGRKLETVAIGGRTYTSREALERFARHDGGNAEAVAIRTPKQRERAIRQAEAELAKAGI